MTAAQIIGIERNATWFEAAVARITEAAEALG